MVDIGITKNVGLDKPDCFQLLINRIVKKTSGWKEKLLSAGGKDILLKSVVQAIPTYAMPFFKIPKTIVKESLMRCRISGGETRSTTGGMGFRDIHCFNLAMLAKQAWYLLESPDSLCATILRAKYYPHGDLLNTKLKKNSSFTWQSIMAGVNSLKHGYIWRVGNGKNISI
uniref:Uncharacterized protein n=1 Tax=Aegilops tauschii subsp. strangulata TaxID=200361 RepID=A0A453N7T7_AEGTS